MIVRFLQDFQGRETGGLFFLKGAVQEFEQEIAEQLTKNNFAVLVEDVPEIVEDAPKKRGKK